MIAKAGWSLNGNLQWVINGIRSGQSFYTASPINASTLTGSPLYNGGASVYAIELELLRLAGYVKQGDLLVPPGWQ